MTRTVRRVFLAVLSAILATGSLLAATAAPTSAVPVTNIVVTSSDNPRL